MRSAVEQASSAARSIGCPACLDPARWSRHRERLGCSLIEARRDLVVGYRRRRPESPEREIADRLGLSASMVHSDLVARRIAPLPQTRGLNRTPPTPEQLQLLQEGNRRYRADVERVKAERGLIDRDELVTHLRRAGVPRSNPAIVQYVHDGLIEPERGLGFEKPWLFSEASADALVRRLLSKYQDGRLTRFNPTTEEAARFRAGWYQARHKSEGEFGRLAPIIGKGAQRSNAARELEQQIGEALGAGMTRSATALQVGCTVRYVREVAERLGLPRGKPGRPRGKPEQPPQAGT